MKFYHIIRTFILLPILLLTIGCSVDTVEESDADILDPTFTDISFQNLPIIDGVGGSLIPLDEIPVVTTEKTREDDDFHYWQLKANPAPIHEDLVIGVNLYGRLAANYQVKLKNIKVGRSTFLKRGRAFENQGMALRFDNIATQVSSEIYKHFNSEGHFVHKYADYFLINLREGHPIVIVIPKGQNTSQEFKLPLSYILEKNMSVSLDISTAALEGYEGTRHDITINCEVEEEVIMDLAYRLEVMSYFETESEIVTNSFGPDDGRVPTQQQQIFALIDVPIFQTFEGYIIREGFAFSYYTLGEARELELEP